MVSTNTVLEHQAIDADRRRVLDRFTTVRERTEKLCGPLEIEDYVVQSMPDVSPPKWHLGHTTWFFERVILQEYEADFKPSDERFYFVFNSYYESFGERVERVQRGTLSRPTVREVMAYRRSVTERVLRLVDGLEDRGWEQVAPLLELGCHHEEQHQELFVYDIKHILRASPFLPVYAPRTVPSQSVDASALRFVPFAGGTVEIGSTGNGFSYDNEGPRHRAYTEAFQLAQRTVTCGEFLEFIEAGGYRDHRLWLSDGWAWVQQERIGSPLYWEHRDGWQVWTLSGLLPIDLAEPVCHVNYYEATAFARWAQRRLPTEVEWETAALAQKVEHATGTFLDAEVYHPVARTREGGPQDALHALFGDVWEWTLSAYLPYPGYRQSRDALSEYNGKFMSNQMVLRGGSCATPRDHFRISYRNFFQCDKRWPLTGIRLADDA